jgi:hypothetical protein
MQTDRFGEHAPNIQARQYCAFPGLPFRHFAPQHSGRAMLANLPRWKHRVARAGLHVLTLRNHATRLFHIWQALSYLENAVHLVVRRTKAEPFKKQNHKNIK